MSSSNAPQTLPESCLQLLELQAVLQARPRLNPREFFKRLPMQELIRQDSSIVHTLLVTGGNRSSKTTVFASLIIEECVKRKLRVWCTAETFQDSINIQQRKVWELLPKHEMKYCFYDEINGFRHNKVIYKSGAIVIFKSYDQGREAFQSDDVDIIWNDEEPPYDIYKEQRMRLIDRNGRMFISMTSLKGVTDLVQDVYENADVLQSQYAELVDEKLPRVMQKGNIKIYTLWTTENTYINQERVAEEAKLMTRQEIKSRIYGIPINLAGRIYPTFSKDVHVIPFSEVPTTKVTLYNVLDPHDRKPWALQWWVVHATGTAYCVREEPWFKNFNEIEFDDKTYDDYAALILGVEKELKEIFNTPIHRRIIDPNFGNKTVQLARRTDSGQAHTTPAKELLKRGLRYIDGIDAIEAGHLQVRKWLHWEEKDGEIVVQPKCLIVEDCQNTIRHLSRYSRKDIDSADGDVKDKVRPMEKYKDYSDTTRYFFMSNPRYVNPKELVEELPRKVY